MKSNILILLSFMLFFNNSIAQEKNILQQAAKNIDIEKLKFPDYPTYENRDFWDNLPQSWRNSVISSAEKSLDYNWPIATAWGYLEFKKSGDRGPSNGVYGGRKSHLELFVLAECMEGKGRFLPQIVNGVYAICEQTAWSISAHLSLQKKGNGLPDHEEDIIDLSTGELASNLAMTQYLLKSAFDKIHPLINERISYEIKKRVLDVYYARKDFWWQGYRNPRVNNWNSWINYNVMNCILTVEDRPEKRTEGIKKVLESFDFWLNFYKNDGACEEGATYWGHAGGIMCNMLDLMHKASDGKFNVFSHPKVRNIITFLMYNHIGENRFVNFADASPYLSPEVSVIYRMAKHMNDDDLKVFAKHFASKSSYKRSPYFLKKRNLCKAIPSLAEGIEWMEKPDKNLSWNCKYYPETQFLFVQDRDEKNGNLFFAAKGGYNAESHNHNDAGSFILYCGGKPFLADAGSGTYTKKTFSPRRYEIWTMQSDYHNVPMINGVPQKFGIKYKASEVKFQKSRNRALFSLEMAKAYPKEAKVASWKRNYDFRYGKSLSITDSFHLTTFEQPHIQHFLTPAKVERNREGQALLTIDGVKMLMSYSSALFSLETEDVEITDPVLKRRWPNGLKRIRLISKSRKLKGKQKITFTKLPAQKHS
ncbi:MAG: heparinase II/III-family protein [Cytophagales bacterium]|nr:heparinase II/III-family protein [Cytophagales bacterium]